MFKIVLLIFLFKFNFAYQFLRFEYSNVTTFSTTTTANCTSAFQCNYNGICGEDHKCYCNNGYITYKSDIGCNYKQKSTLIAFLLELFLGPFSGAGYFYLGLNELGAGQLVYMWGGLCILQPFLAAISNNKNPFPVCFTLMWVISIIFWWLYAIILIGKGQIYDSNGAPIPSL